MKKIDDISNKETEEAISLKKHPKSLNGYQGNTEEILASRIKKLINWLKKPNNFILVGILIFAFVLRLYYFHVTQNQALWWDEAEYMNMARAWAGDLAYHYTFVSVRPVLLSLIISIFWRIGSGEFLARIFIFIISMVSIFGVYLLGKEMYDEKLGLIVAFFMSVFYLHLFQTFRVLVDLPSLTFFTFSIFFFYRYFKTKEKKMLYFGAALVAIGTLFRITTAMLLFAILIYLLITERLSFLRKKEYYIAGAIFVLILLPYIIWGYFQFNGFVITQAGAWNAPQGSFLANGFENMKSYFSASNFKFDLTWPLLIFFYLGIIFMYKLILGFDILIKGENFELKRDLLLILLVIIPILTVCFSISNFYDDRYIITVFPIMFIISTAFILKSYEFIKKGNKLIAIILLFILIGYIGYLQLQNADSVIKIKAESYYPVKEAGIWLKENSGPYDKIMSISAPQIEYYSERRVVGNKNSEEDFDKAMANENFTFYMVSVFEKHPQWVLDYPKESNLTPVRVYFADAQQQNPILIIYKMPEK
ncbi:MAG: glycosyltransferase family 39 protein [Candidatus Nanoarchaeia archaeon]|nr:glycosyltransferase family 39 protein [Candidatus Nanoarchaeia archaeon]MDD5741419.1 glycosyltransferase family 39 protein [Candidatus Nanoarchaeia archaeon]